MWVFEHSFKWLPVPFDLGAMFGVGLYPLVEGEVLSFPQHGWMCSVQILFWNFSVYYLVNSLNEYGLGSFWEEQGINPEISLWGFPREKEIFWWGHREGKCSVCWKPLSVAGLQVWICIERAQLEKAAFAFKTFHVVSSADLREADLIRNCLVLVYAVVVAYL